MHEDCYNDMSKMYAQNLITFLSEMCTYKGKDAVAACAPSTAPAFSSPIGQSLVRCYSIRLLGSSEATAQLL